MQSGVSFETDVRFGIEREAFRVTGCGAKRTLADVFSIYGKKNARSLAGALNILNKYLNGFGSENLSHTDGLKLIEEHPDFEKSVEKGVSLYNTTRFIEPSLGTCLHYLFALKDADKADDFFAFLREGIGATGPKDPRHLYRERLIANKADKAKLETIDIAALGIKAWNTFRAGKTVGTLKWLSNPSKGKAEPFPRVA